MDIGNRFGDWTVIHREHSAKGHTRWLCRCVCGAERIVYSTSLTSGKSKSCGCGCIKYKDLTGNTYGRLTVISIAHEKNGRGQILWDCVCSCGKKARVLARCLTGGNTKSCGCLIRYADKTLSSKYKLYDRYRRSSIVRGHDFDLPIDHFNTLIQQNCHYCGHSPSLHFKACGVVRDGGFVYNGIDRKNGGGYRVGNVVPCCKPCNYLKWDRTEEEFVLWVTRCHANISTIAGAVPQILYSDSSEILFYQEKDAIRKMCPGYSYYSMSTLYSTYIRMANSRGFSFRLKAKEFFEITQERCFYCGVSPYKNFRKGKSGFIFNGVDRIDSTLGYVMGNVVPCCHMCNISKSNLTIQEFSSRIESCFKHLGCATPMIPVPPLVPPALKTWIKS